MSCRIPYALTLAGEQATARRSPPPVHWSRIERDPALEQLETPCASCGAGFGEHLVDEPHGCEHTGCPGFRAFANQQLERLAHEVLP